MTLERQNEIAATVIKHYMRIGKIDVPPPQFVDFITYADSLGIPQSELWEFLCPLLQESRPDLFREQREVVAAHSFCED